MCTDITYASRMKPSTLSKYKEAQDVRERARDTKKEIEELKANLQQLIETGIHGVRSTKPIAANSGRVEKQAQPATARKGQNHVRPQLKESKTSSQLKEPKQSPHSNESAATPKKAKSYNVDEARDYMRKQREKRTKELKSQIQAQDKIVDLKKQKLEELQKTTSQLVARNIQLKRERSKSRERVEKSQVRLDKSTVKERSRSKDRHNEAIISNRVGLRQNESRKDNREAPAKTSNENCDIIPIENKSNLLNIPGSSSSNCEARKISVQKSLSFHGKVCSKRTTKLKSDEIPADLHKKTHFPKKQLNRNLLCPPEFLPNYSSLPKACSTKCDVSNIRPINLENTIYPPTLNLSDKTFNPESRLSHSTCTNDTEESKAVKEREVMPKSEHSIVTDACLKETKETQTVPDNPLWRSPPIPYPYNFISTVRRKLHFALQSPTKVADVGVQSSIVDSSAVSMTPEWEKSQKISRPILDLKALENLELVPNKLNSSETLSDDSESDTWKNIPDISSESAASLRKTTSKSNPKLNLDDFKCDIEIDKLKQFNLQPQSETSSSSRTITNFPSTNERSNNEEKQANRNSTIVTEVKTYSSNFCSTQKASEKSSKSRKISKTISVIEENNDQLSDDTFISTNSNLEVVHLGPKKLSYSFAQGNSNSASDKKNKQTYSQYTFQSLVSDSQLLTVPSRQPSDSEISENLSSVDTVQTQSSKQSSHCENPKFVDNNKIIVKSDGKTSIATLNKANEIHLKFEAEVHLLNDFNESLKQFMAVEKAYENLKSKPDLKIVQNADTQTSMVTKTSSETTKKLVERSRAEMFINSSRGSEVNEAISIDELNISKPLQDSFISNRLDSTLNSSITSLTNGSKVELSVANMENFNLTNCTGLSLNMFEQLIRDEDARIENLKTVIKILERALLDRTKGELAWLEIQRKQFIETGKIEEASLVKKKQRGIIVKHEQEKNEMRKLKQMQKAASQEHKSILKQQRNLIKSQLSTWNMYSKVKVTAMKERRHSGPLRVMQSCNESIRSEKSISAKMSSGSEEMLSVISSKSLTISRGEYESNFDNSTDHDRISSVKAHNLQLSNVKRTLSMKEAALQKRRRVAEELLQWHRKLLEEEKKISKLEAVANSVIAQTPSDDLSLTKKQKFTGLQLNQLWNIMTGRPTKKFVDNKVYIMSQIDLEKFFKNAKHYDGAGGDKNDNNGDNNNIKSTNLNTSELPNIIGDSNKHNLSSDTTEITTPKTDKSPTDNEYSSDFDSDFINKNIEDEKLSSLSKLIDNFTKIEDEISLLSRKSEDVTILEEDCNKSPVSEELSENCQIIIPKFFDVKEGGENISDNKIETESYSTQKFNSNHESRKTSPTLESPVISSVNENDGVNQEEIVKNNFLGADGGDVEEDYVTSAEKSEKTVTSKEKLAQSDLIESNIEKPSDNSLSNVEITSELIEEFSSSEDKSISDVTSIKSDKITDNNIEDIPTNNRLEIIENDDDIEEKKSLVSTDDECNKEIIVEKSSNILTVDENKSDRTLDNHTSLLSIEIDEEATENDDNLQSVADEFEQIDEEKTKVTEQSSESSSNKINVKKRVSEILADASISRGDKSPRLQDLYVTTYDVISPENSPDSDSSDEGKQTSNNSIFGNEAEELLKKQLAIEQEIKQLEQQQKEQIPYVFMREIPNKPPPPYTPPSSLPITSSVLPSDQKEINEITNYSSKLLYKAYQSNNFDKVKFSENSFKLISTLAISKQCGEFLFNICKEIAQSHYKQFEKDNRPTWLMLNKKTQLVALKPFDANGLEKHMNRKLKELFGFKKIETVENAIIKWSRKKRDHVDEILVLESQEEEPEWINFDQDELYVKDQLVRDIMKMLIDETANVFSKILAKKPYLP